MANRDVSALTAPLHLGSAGDRTVVEQDGSLKFEGAATVWEDLDGRLNGSSLYTAAGKADYSFTEVCVVLQPSGSLATAGDVVELAFQVKHAAKAGSPLKLHIHWEQTDATARQFSYTYRVQKQGAAKTADWATTVVVSTTTAGVNAFTYTSGVLNQISSLGEITLTDVGISAIVQVKLTRTDAVVGDINVTYLDAHYEIDTVGSRQEYVK